MVWGNKLLLSQQYLQKAVNAKRAKWQAWAVCFIVHACTFGGVFLIWWIVGVFVAVFAPFWGFLAWFGV
ncbi:hypothetical protein LU293_07385 [Moraxella nasovis]|uniref:hypothetical protein n=1 Tax=Moraxella nasovis TaxID=2904121 RepID=UPI001F620A00|nr:hypothetical protein [Moraxella nasovis]UNU72910.1 hypothetical protein LU293_07385 [Moraxella nasovis]